MFAVPICFIQLNQPKLKNYRLLLTWWPEEQLWVGERYDHGQKQDKVKKQKRLCRPKIRGAELRPLYYTNIKLLDRQNCHFTCLFVVCFFPLVNKCEIKDSHSSP